MMVGIKLMNNVVITFTQYGPNQALIEFGQYVNLVTSFTFHNFSYRRIYQSVLDIYRDNMSKHLWKILRASLESIPL